MFYAAEDNRIKTYGRWGADGDALTCTACGGKIEFRYTGEQAVLRFDTAFNAPPYPHIWLRVDGGARVEAALCDFLRVSAPGEGPHLVEAVYKSAMEQQSRWYSLLVGKVTFRGVYADGLAASPVSNKKTIEFVGDSITEGVLIDTATVNERENLDWDQKQRPYQDDVTATYAYLAAEALGLEPLFTAYGAVGVTKGGCGGVPRCAEGYPYAFDGVRKRYSNPDFILINHGTNDRVGPADVFVSRYRELLRLIAEDSPLSRVIVLPPFCGAFREELRRLVGDYNRETGRGVAFIDSSGWIPPEPVHPTREGHKEVARRLIPALREITEETSRAAAERSAADGGLRNAGDGSPYSGDKTGNAGTGSPGFEGRPGVTADTSRAAEPGTAVGKSRGAEGGLR